MTYLSKIKELAGINKRCSLPIIIVDNDQEPKCTGRSYYWTTPNGTLCIHPNAYRANWGKPVYNSSTRRIEVGKKWLSKIAGGNPSDLRSVVLDFIYYRT